MKKLIVFVICLTVFSLLFTACFKNSGDETTTDPTETTEETEASVQAVKESKIKLGYYKEKSLNPYLTDSPTNLMLSTLIYDSLFLPMENYTVEPLIADSYTYDGNRLIVTLKEDICFSDGSAISPYDIIYSFNQAKLSPAFSGRLSNIVSCEKGSTEIIFLLEGENIFAHNCLTFPILKSGIADDTLPVGSGRYTLSEKDGIYILTANESSTRNEEMATKEIYLTEITSEKNELYLLQTGDLSYFFDDMTDGEYTKIVANTSVVNLNNLVYLGCNYHTEEFYDINVLNAISYAIDRYTIIDTAYDSLARSTVLPFNPLWEELSSVQTPSTVQNITKAQELLEESGYVFAYKNNKVRSKNMEYIELTLIVNNESEPKLICARLIKEQLESIGIGINLKELTFEEYKNALNRGEYDLYVGETKLSADMSLHNFFTEGGSLGFGIDSMSTVATAYNDFVGGKIDITTFIQVFELQKPFIPICFRDAIAYYSRELSYDDTVNEYEPFKNIYTWSVRG